MSAAPGMPIRVQVPETAARTWWAWEFREFLATPTFGSAPYYWKYPKTSKKKLVLPEGMSHWTEIWPPVPSGTTALLARTMPGRKLMALASGAAAPAG